MKQQYTAPESELVKQVLSSFLLEDSLVEYYGGEDATLINGEW